MENKLKHPHHHSQDVWPDDERVRLSVHQDGPCKFSFTWRNPYSAQTKPAKKMPRAGRIGMLVGSRFLSAAIYVLVSCALCQSYNVDDRRKHHENVDCLRSH